MVGAIFEREGDLHEFNFAKSLQTVKSDLMKLVEGDNLLWVLLVKVNAALLRIDSDLLIEAAGVTMRTALFFLPIHDHRSTFSKSAL